MQLSLFGRVALLHFRAASGEGLRAVRLGRPRGAAEAVSSRPAAEQNDYVAGSRGLTHNAACGDSPRDRAYLQPLCDVAVVVYLVHYARGKPYLVAV